jgi:hypothetical protein
MGAGANEYRVVWKREGCHRKERRFARVATAERFLLLFGPEPWTAYGAEPGRPYCCSGYECGCGGLTERQRTAEERAKMPPLEYVRMESRLVGLWEEVSHS